MLTRDLLLYRVQRGCIVPRFVDVADPTLLHFAQQLVSLIDNAQEMTRGALMAACTALTPGSLNGKVAKGIIKTITDRVDFAEVDDTVGERRLALFQQCTHLMRQLADDATLADYEQALQDHVGTGLATARATLYDDHPDQRPILGWTALTAVQALERYNMAQAQGLIMYSHRLRITTQQTDSLRLRRVLRWLKFCRLVADVAQTETGWQLDISGPAAMFSVQKKYGLQLASFLPVVPVLENFTIEAEIAMRPPATWQLTLQHTHPLVSPHGRALGFIPPEVAHVAGQFVDDDWQLDLDAQARHVGANGMCVPDFIFRHRAGAVIFVELFHRWHQHALKQRIDDLRARPDPQLILGVDKALHQETHVQALLADDGVAFAFNSFPSERALRAVLHRCLTKHTASC